MQPLVPHAPGVNVSARTQFFFGFARLSKLAPCLAAVVLILASTTARAGIFFPETFTLSNGMQVVVVNNPRAPVVTHMVWYKVGAADEPFGKSGIAHLLEHLMFKATSNAPAGEFSRLVALQGGRDNAFTSWDYTAYFQSIVSDQLELVMRMEADRMANLQLTEEAVTTERAVVIEERRQRIGSDPTARLAEEMRGTLFLHHPYGRPIIGWAHELAALDQRDAEAFYRIWYTPANAILVVSGDVTMKSLKPLAETYYGAVVGPPAPNRSRVQEPTLSTSRRIVLTDSQARQPSFGRFYKAPSYSQGNAEQAEPLEVLAEILGGGTLGRLYRNLVVERKLATGADADYSPTAVDLSVFAFHVTPAPGSAISTVEMALDREIEQVLRDGVTQAEVAEAKQRLLTRVAYAKDSLMGPAYALGAALASGLTIDHVENWPDRIEAVTQERVNEAARAVLGQAEHVDSQLLPAVTEVSPP